MKKFILLLSLLVVSSTVGAVSSDTIKVVREKVVELRITRHDVKTLETKKNRRARIEELSQSNTICSGAVAGPNGLILTARHCTEGASQIDVVFSDGREYKALVIGSSVRHDLALIHVARFNIPFFNLATTLIQGQAIYVMGSPLGITGTLSEGIVAKRNGDVDFVDVNVLPGNSGGPAFNEKGELVGITTAGFIVLNGFAHLNIMQSIDAILGFALELQGAR